MLSVSPEWSNTAVDVELWRDYNPVAQRLPGMCLGTRAIRGPIGSVVTTLYDAGVRYLRLMEPVRLCHDASARSARALLLVRESTSWGLAVSWTAVCNDGCAAHRMFHHLYPPGEVLGAPDEVVADWQAAYSPAKCVFRRGPGFVEVRDRRFGPGERLTLDDPDYLELVETLTEGVAASVVPRAVRDDLDGVRLTTEHAGHLWWLPMGMHRWPFPAQAI